MYKKLLLLAGLTISRCICAPTAQADMPEPGAAEHEHGAAAWDEGAVHEFQVHPSCNHSEETQLRKALQDAVTLADHAKQHILRHSNASEHYRKYFGEGPSGQVLGWYDKIINGDRGRALFRCDNPDGNCALPGKLWFPIMLGWLLTTSRVWGPLAR